MQLSALDLNSVPDELQPIYRPKSDILQMIMSEWPHWLPNMGLDEGSVGKSSLAMEENTQLNPPATYR